MLKSKSSKSEPELQGEGNRTADRSYRKAATQHAASGASDKAARAAVKALQSPERTQLEAAEAKGKARAKRTGGKKP